MTYPSGARHVTHAFVVQAPQPAHLSHRQRGVPAPELPVRQVHPARGRGACSVCLCVVCRPCRAARRCLVVLFCVLVCTCGVLCRAVLCCAVLCRVALTSYPPMPTFTPCHAGGCRRSLHCGRPACSRQAAVQRCLHRVPGARELHAGGTRAGPCALLPLLLVPLFAISPDSDAMPLPAIRRVAPPPRCPHRGPWPCSASRARWFPLSPSQPRVALWLTTRGVTSRPSEPSRLLVQLRRLVAALHASGLHRCRVVAAPAHSRSPCPRCYRGTTASGTPCAGLLRRAGATTGASAWGVRTEGRRVRQQPSLRHRNGALPTSACDATPRSRLVAARRCDQQSLRADVRG